MESVADFGGLRTQLRSAVPQSRSRRHSRCCFPGRESAGRVGLDEAISDVGKTPVVGLREHGGSFGTEAVDPVNKKNMVAFIERHIEPDATIYSDNSAVDDVVTDDKVNHGTGQYVDGPVRTNSIESVGAVLKRSITGTWHHGSPKHLTRYVNEAAFRLNEGNCEVDTIERMEAPVDRIDNRRLRQDLVSEKLHAYV